MLQVESTVHTNDENELPWEVNPINDAEIIDATGAVIASFEVRHHLKGVMGNCAKNADLTVRAVNAYKNKAVSEPLTIRSFQRQVTEWADRLFPNRTPDEIVRKMQEETAELLKDKIDAGEYADVLILVLDLASQHGIDVEKAVSDKMAINESRQWYWDAYTGVMRHVK